MPRTIKDSIHEGLAIRGMRVHYKSCFFTGVVSHQDGDGKIVAKGTNLFGKATIKGSAQDFEIIE